MGQLIKGKPAADAVTVHLIEEVKNLKRKILFQSLL